MYKNNNKKEILELSRKIMPGGVNSPVRAFQSVNCEPVIVESAKGAYIKDIDGTEYIDYVCSYGPLIFGHSPEFLLDEIKAAVVNGTTYGFTTPHEVELAEMVIDSYPACEMVRMVNSGTEATMSAIRVARGYTKRDKILKFEGCYHGHSDSLLVKSGSGLLTQGVPTSPGLVQALTDKTLVCPYNDEEALEQIIAANKHEIACVIIEPVAGNMGVLPPKEGYLKKVRELCTKDDIILIFDEVITGFRLDYHSAAGVYGVEPDMVCFGKIIGGGLPIGAYGGKLDIMKMVSPIGPVYQGGTLSGNPLAVRAGIANLTRLKSDPKIYETLNNAATYLNKGMTAIFEKYNIPAVTSQKNGMFCVFFTDKKVECFEDVMSCDLNLYKKFFEGMMQEGILLAPAQFEGWFPSTAHTKDILDKTLAAADKVLKNIN